ncbi:MAG: condensation domain-containing protein [Coleofasciculus sp. S288]|nr:condensation domain-containing protein [Coleofasciculus sp. S288]
MKPLELENSILSQAGAIDKNQTKEGTGTVPVNSNNSAAAPTELWQAIRTIIALQNQAPPLEPMQRQANLPLSFSQERLWLLNQLQPESSAHHIPIGLRIKGALNVPALEQSLNEIIRRHETLRTTFETIQGQPVQLIAPYQTLTLDLLDLRLLSSQERESETLRLAREQTMRPFDLKAGPLLRASLLQLDEQEYVLLLTLHQVIFDGWSQGVLFQELAALYDALSAGLPSPLSELPIQYADFALWQRHSLQGEFLQALLSYWQQQLGEGLAVQHLPTDRQLPLVPSRRSACQTLVLPQSLTEALKSFSRQEGVTLFATLLAAFKVLLHRYTQQDDLFVCTPTANRTRSQTKGLIGYFVNLLILRTDLSGNPSFRQLLARVRSCASAAFAHQDLPVQQLINALNLVNMPLSQVMFTLQNLPKQPLKLAGLSVEPLTLDNGMADFDLSVSLVETATEITGVWKYNTDLFEDATISQMLAHFHSLLETLVANPEQQLLSLPLYRENVNFQTLGTLNSEGSKPERAFVAPRTPTEEALADIWAEVFGLEQVGVHDDFFSLGGHSMLAIQLLSRMRDAFQLDLPSRYLFQSPTVAGLAECIEELQTKTLPSQAEQQSESSVVIIQPGGSKKPFFFIPGAGGNEIEFVVYANLGRYMNPEQPVYGLKARSFDAEGNPYTKLEALAVDYVKEIRAAQPDGPYFLGGECVGGVLAFEIAQQLLAEGQKVALLVLMDATKPNNAAYLIYRPDR